MLVPNFILPQYEEHLYEFNSFITLKNLFQESECSIFHEPNESFLSGRSDEQNWDTAVMDEEMLVLPNI